MIGGGSTPDQQLPTCLIAVASRRHSAAAVEERLRAGERNDPRWLRASKADRVVLDLRTVLPDEEAPLASALLSALA